MDQEALIDVYEEIAPQTFRKAASHSSVFDYCIICDVNVTAEAGTKKR
jgi:hypothetical protein